MTKQYEERTLQTQMMAPLRTAKYKLQIDYLLTRLSRFKKPSIFHTSLWLKTLYKRQQINQISLSRKVNKT